MSKDLDRARAAATLAEAAVSLRKSSAVFEAQSISSGTALQRAARRLLRRIAPEDDTEATSCEGVELDASELDLAKTAKVLIDAADKVREMDAAAAEELDLALNRVLAQIRWFAWDESTEDEIKEERSKSIQELLEEHDQICRPSRKQRVRSRPGCLGFSIVQGWRSAEVEKWFGGVPDLSIL